MANNYIKTYTQSTKPTVDHIFDQLEKFQQFCVEYGHVYNPAHLNRENNPVFKEFIKYQKGKSVRNHWAEDAKKFDGKND